VDQLYERAVCRRGICPTLKLVDFALDWSTPRKAVSASGTTCSMVPPFSAIYAALYFKRRGNGRVLGIAVAAGAIDTVQAYAE